MKTLLFGGSLKSVTDKICENFDVKFIISTIENVKSDFDLEELIKHNFNFIPKYNEKAQEILIDFYNNNFDTFCRMFIRKGPLLNDYHELTNHFTLYFYCLNEILITKKIDLIIFNNFPHQGVDFILYKLAKKLNIKTIMLTQTIFPNKYIIVSDLKNFGDYENINKDYDKRTIEEIMSIKDIHREFSLKLGMDLKKKGLPPHTHPSKSQYFSTYVEKKKENILKKITNIKLIKKTILKLFIYLKIIKRKDLEQIYQKNLQSIELKNDKIEEIFNLKNKKIFFALHSQPEMSTSLLAGNFDDQIRVLEKLNRNVISSKFTLLAKEHPIQNQYQRDYMFFKRLKYLNNVHFLNKNYSTKKILNSVDVIVTCSGTIGFEGLLVGKKCLTFGQSWYSKLHGVLKVEKDTSDEKILDFLNKEFDYDKFYISLQNLYNSFKDGIVLKTYTPYVDNFDEINNAKKITESIIEFTKDKKKFQ